MFILHQPPTNTSQPKLKSNLEKKKAYQTLAASIQNTRHLPTDAKLEIQGNRAVEFSLEASGFYPDIPQTILTLSKQPQSTEVTVAGVNTPPRKKLKDLNNLGINELLGRGRSSFKGSSKNRRTNIKVGMGKTQGIILAPGETFSFNSLVGGVTAEDGFVPEIVIKKDGLAPELGGGLCQVSSTIFRGAVASGLTINQRKNHSFAVSHYSPQGTDATTYTGVIDLKFTNNTPGHLLIWPSYENEDTIVYDYYGTPDGRKVTVSEPVQFDKKSDGSMKAVWERKVELNNQVSTDEFKSTYLPPSQFKKVETFVPSANPPEGANQQETSTEPSNNPTAQTPQPN